MEIFRVKLGSDWAKMSWVQIFCQEMADDRWRMTDDARQMTDDRWQMTDGRWQMADDRWQMADDRWQMTDDRLQMTDDRWQMTDDRWWMMDEMLHNVLDRSNSQNLLIYPILNSFNGFWKYWWKYIIHSNQSDNAIKWDITYNGYFGLFLTNFFVFVQINYVTNSY